MIGGWVGFFSYDTVRYVEKKKIPFSGAPQDDRNLPDVHLGLYDDVLVFDNVEKVLNFSIFHFQHVILNKVQIVVVFRDRYCSTIELLSCYLSFGSPLPVYAYPFKEENNFSAQYTSLCYSSF